MRQLIKFIFLLILTTVPAFSAIKSGVEYSIPIDYSKLSKEELETKAGFYYNLALKTCTNKPNEEMTSALNLYTILNNKNPDEILYNIRLGVLYDKIGIDKQAKGHFYAAIGCDNTQPEAYYRFGEFYYKRSLLKKALKMYKEAYKKGYDTHYETLYQIGDIYEKLGDTEAALKYLKLASQQSPNSNLDAKIQKVELADKLNLEYYVNTRIRINER